MRILQFVQKPQRRGAEIFAFQLSAALRRMGHEVSTTYLYPYDGQKPLDVLPGDRVLDGVETHPLEKTLGHNPSLLRRVDAAIDRENPDVIQLNGARTVKYGALSKRRRSRVPWRLIYRNIDNPAYWARDPVRRWFYRNRIFPEIDGTVGVSESTLKRVLEMYDLRTPSTFIPNGFDPIPLEAAPSREEARRLQDIDIDVPLMLFIGNLTEQKRPDRFLRMVAAVRQRLPEAQAWLLGSGPLEEQLKRQAKELSIEDSVRFLGYQKNVASFIAACDLLVVTSDSDGIPAVVLEAGYLSKPTVSTRVGGMHECVVNGQTGHLVEADDEKGLAEKVHSLLVDVPERTRMGEEAHRFVSQQFTIDVVASRYFEFYKRVLEQAT